MLRSRLLSQQKGWQLVTVSTTSRVARMLFANGVYLSNAGSEILVSTDGGITFIKQAKASVIRQIESDGRLFLIVDSNTSGTFQTSSDGINWTSRSLGYYSSNITAIRYLNGLWLIGGGGTLCTSTDGITFTQNSYGPTSLRDLAYGDNTYVSIADRGVIRYTSTPGGSWYSPSSNPATTTLFYCAYGNGMFVAGGVTANLVVSYDAGRTWSHVPIPMTFTSVVTVSFCNGWFFICSGNSIYKSLDCSKWINIPSPFTAANEITVHYVNGRYIFTATNGQMAYKFNV